MPSEMSDEELDVVAVGNAMVDVMANTDDEFLAQRGITKGGMVLIDEKEADTLYAAMGPGVEAISGGSAANTMAGLASLGGKPGYLGKVSGDALGDIFSNDMRAAGIHYATPPAGTGPATARCLILVTPDAQRTMNTYLGACVNFGPNDLDEDLIRRSKVTYLEGYLWDRPLAKEAFVKASEIAASAGRKVALSLSDSFCVARHRESFLELVDKHVDILFANEAEITSLYETSDFDEAASQIREKTDVAALTRGAAGSVLLRGSEQATVPAAPVARVLDTTGAGDQFAAGVLHGLAQGRSLFDAGTLGALAAAEVISHFGARPVTRLADLPGLP